MKTTLVDTLKFDNGEVYQIISGRRIKLSDCSVKAELYQQETKLPALGGGILKKQKISIVVCDDVDGTECDFDKVSRFEVCVEFRRTDGVYERIFMHDLAVNEIEEHGEWRFELLDSAQVQRLFELASW